MKVYNTYTNSLEEFVSIDKNKVKMYVCGPTVYNYIHIGNARPTVFFDTVRRYLEKVGYEVTYVSNVTDVNDKIYQKANELGIDEFVHARNMTEQYLKDIKELNVLDYELLTKVTEYIPSIVEFIENLIKKDFAYISKNNDVYFRINKISEYGKLSGQKVEELLAGNRVEINEFKENPLDFVLWKSSTTGKLFDASFGKGRPGWHTECVCMITESFGGKIDIHGGGSDLRFPHHENEIAQSIALNGHTLANYWMHNARLDFGSDKMSKSKGNVVWLKDLLALYDGNSIRFMLLQNHYRQVISYTPELMENCKKEVIKIERTIKQVFLKLDLEDKFNDKYSETFQEFNNEMNNDFNTSNALTVIYKSSKIINTLLRESEIDYFSLASQYNSLSYMLEVFGLDFKLERLDSSTKEIYLSWLDARQNKDFSKADELRSILETKGVI